MLLFHGPWLLLLLVAGGFIVFGGTAVSQNTLLERYDGWLAQEIPVTLDALAPSEPPAEVESDQPLEFVVGDKKMKESGKAASQPPSQAAGSDPGDQSSQKPPPRPQPPRDGKSTGPPIATTGSGSKADGEAEEKSSEANPPEQVSELAELLVKRRSMLPTPNTTTTFLVAKSVAAVGRFGQARHMMRSLAPLGDAGYGPAHVWLAFDNLQPNAIESREDLREVTHDLEVAVSVKNVDPQLLAAYSNLLESTGKPADAINALERVRDDGSSLEINMRIAQLSAKHGRVLALKRASELIKSEVRDRMEQGVLNSSDFADLSHLFLLEENPTQARKVALRGLGLEADHLELKRLLSESYRIEYLVKLGKGEAKPTLDLGLLKTAFESDPSNPAISIETAKLIATGREVPEDLMLDLQLRLADGTALPLAHIITADTLLLKGDLASAIPHLEVAYQKDPNDASIMNNLALALAMTDASALERALDLSMSATALEPSNIEFVDTLGEIRALSGDKVGAIECYEFVIRGEGKRTNTRQRLAKLYRELGMVDLAEIQERVLKPSDDL